MMTCLPIPFSSSICSRAFISSTFMLATPSDPHSRPQVGAEIFHLHDQPRLGDLILRNLDLSVLSLQHDGRADHAKEEASEMPLSLDRPDGLDLHFLTGEAAKVGIAAQQSVQPRGGYLQRVPVRKQVVEIQLPAESLIDPRALLHSDPPVGAVHQHAQHGPMGISRDCHLYGLQPHTGGDRLQDLLDLCHNPLSCHPLCPAARPRRFVPRLFHKKEWVITSTHSAALPRRELSVTYVAAAGDAVSITWAPCRRQRRGKHQPPRETHARQTCPRMGTGGRKPKSTPPAPPTCGPGNQTAS